MSSAFTDDVSVLLSAGGGKFHSVARYDAGLQPYALVTADFNRDGRLDLAVANSGSTASLLPGTISILLGGGDGSFGAPASYDAGKLPTFIATEDFDRDGALDLAVVNHQSANVAIFLGHGDGTFEAAVEYPVGSNPIGIVVADFNGDGRSDLATGSASAGGTGQASILPGNGDGTFRPAINSTVPGNGITAVAGGDLDGDGKTDLAVANYYSGDVVIMRGGGDGTFQPAGSLPAFGPSSVAVGDFDADGKADLAVGNFGNVKIAVFLGSGDGAFRAAGSYEVGNFPITVADFNGDSRADLAVANLNDHYVSILQGNGDGTFRDALDYGSGKGPSALAVGDFNRDGKPDLAMTGFWFNDVSVLLNDCAAGTLTVPEREQAAGPEITGLAPNPARADARVEYAIPVAMVVDLSVFDAEGRRVAALFSGPQGPGCHSQWVRGGMLPPGTYWCRLAAGGVTRSRALIVLR